jgi:hypothetical protein
MIKQLNSGFKKYVGYPLLFSDALMLTSPKIVSDPGYFNPDGIENPVSGKLAVILERFKDKTMRVLVEKPKTFEPLGDDSLVDPLIDLFSRDYFNHDDLTKPCR